MPGTLAFLHTSHVLIPRFAELSRKELPGVKVTHLVDESLIGNTIAAGHLTKAVTRRTVQLINCAHEGGADAVMVTCSSIGPAVRIARSLYEFPILRIDEAMASVAIHTGRRIGVAATLKTTLDPTLELLREKAAEVRQPIEVVECLCNGAFEKFLAGDVQGHDQVILQALAKFTDKIDVLVLAQASMARVVSKLPPETLRVPVLSSPELAIREARKVLFD